MLNAVEQDGASRAHEKPVRAVGAGRVVRAGRRGTGDYLASALCASAMASAFFSVALACALALSALAEAIFFWAFSSASIAVFCSFRSALATFSSALAWSLEIVRHAFLLRQGRSFPGAPPLAQLETLVPFERA